MLGGLFLQRFSKNRPALFGAIVLLSLIVLATVAPYISQYDPLAMGAGSNFATPSWNYPMGTDDLGRDVLSGVLYGGRVSLLIGFMAALTSAVVGIPVGVFSGFFGGVVDDILMRITEFFQTLPSFILAMIMTAVFRPSIWNIVLVLGLVTWPVTARLVRVEYMSLKEREFVQAAKTIGASDVRIALSEILPNATPPIIINGSLQVGYAILIEAGLSFIGLGDPNVVSWGIMLYNAQSFLRMAPWMAIFPGLAIFLAVLSLNLVGDGLNDALNPKLRET